MLRAPIRFGVIASNNSGVWNEQGDALQFSIAPAYYQTNWFRALCVVVVLALVWAIYQMRLRRLSQDFALMLEARIGERTSIARELHDTLLQSFHGLLLRFQIVSELLPDRPVEAKEQLDRSIDRAAEAITEARDAVQGLRTSTVQTNELARAINTLGEEFAGDPAHLGPTAFRVTVEGAPRDLHPILRDEIYRIAAEGLRNAFRHAEAQQVEVEIRYDDQQFRLRVRDDGKGMDTAVLAGEGPEGHFGLRGMRERAGLIEGKLAIWSEVGVGTELELIVPASSAYTTTRKGSWLSQKFCGKSMIAIRRNTGWALLRASTIVLLCIIHCSFAITTERNSAKVVIAHVNNTPLAQLTAKAAIPPDHEPGADATPRPSQDIHTHDVHALVRDLKFTHLTTNDGLSQGYVVAILQDRRGFMWFATRDGLNRYDGNAFVVYKNNPNDSGSLSSNFLQDLMQDDHGYLWIATNTGVNKFDPDNRTLYPLPS